MSHQDRALELLLTGKTTLEAATAVGVDPRTVRRWKKDPTFAQELSELRQEVHDEIMLRVAALIDKLQTAAFEQLEWLKAMANKLPALTDKLRCMNAISQLNFKWSKFIMDRQDRKEQKTLADLAKLAQKADKNGRVTHGATGAPTAVPSVHPCSDDNTTQKADENGHRPPETPLKPTEIANRTGTGESGIRPPDAPVVPGSSAKADVNGHVPAIDSELQALKIHRAYRERVAAKSAQKAGVNGHRTGTPMV